MAAMEPAPTGTWSLQQTHRIGSALGEFEDKEMLLDRSAIKGVQAALQALSQGRMACKSGVCIVFSEQQRLYFLLWRSDVKETVYEKYGFYDPTDSSEPAPDALQPTPSRLSTAPTADEPDAVNAEEASAVAPSTMEPSAVPAVEPNDAGAVEPSPLPAAEPRDVSAVEPSAVPAMEPCVVPAEEPSAVPEPSEVPSPSRAVANIVSADEPNAEGTIYFNVSVTSPERSHIIKRRYKAFRSLKDQVGDTSGQAFPRKHLFACKGAKLDARREQLDRWLQGSLADRSVDNLPAAWATFLDLSPAQAA